MLGLIGLGGALTTAAAADAADPRIFLTSGSKQQAGDLTQTPSTLTTSVRDHGAIGDGQTDDTAAFQQVLSMVKSAGGGEMFVPPGDYVTNTLLLDAVPNLTIRGASRETTRITSRSSFLRAVNSSDQGTVRDVLIRNTVRGNRDDGIVVLYPRRWIIQQCGIEGFGGDSVRFEGGLQSQIAWNRINAADPSGTNGNAGIHFTPDRSTGLAGTTMATWGNYITAGANYGILCDQSPVLSVFNGDIAEYCRTGLRMSGAEATIINLYTEANKATPFELHDSNATVIGDLKDEPVTTWDGTPAADRAIVRVSRLTVNPGKAIVSGGESAASTPDKAPSIRWGTGDPEGAQVGPVGSLWIRTDGAEGTTLYVKQAGTDATGWAPK